MAWLLLLIGTLCVVECFFRLPLLNRARDLQSLLQRIFRVIRSDSISDCWKEKVLPIYAGRLFLLSIQLFVIVLIALLPMIVLAWLAGLGGIGLFPLLSSWIGIGASTIAAAIYVFVRNRVLNRSL